MEGRYELLGEIRLLFLFSKPLGLCGLVIRTSVCHQLGDVNRNLSFRRAHLNEAVLVSAVRQFVAVLTLHALDVGPDPLSPIALRA